MYPVIVCRESWLVEVVKPSISIPLVRNSILMESWANRIGSCGWAGPISGPD